MTLEKDDPKLTAYALGELPPAEAAEVEAALAQDPALAAEIEAIQGLGAALGEALAAEPLPRLAETQRAAIEAQAGRDTGGVALTHAKPRRRRWYLAEAGVAAGIAAMLLVSVTTSRSALNNTFNNATGTINPDLVAQLDEPASGPPVNYASPPADPTADRVQGLAQSPRLPVGEDVERPVIIHEELAEQRAELAKGAELAPPPPSLPLRQDDPLTKAQPQAGQGQRAQQGAPATPPRAPEPMPPTTAPTPARPAAPQEGRRAELADAPMVAEPAPPSPGKDKQGTNTFGLPAEPPMDPDPSASEQYAAPQENEFQTARETPLSTFSIDVDRASYALVRRFLTQQGTLPPPDAVRLEELINYFPYADAPPANDARHPFAVKVDVAGCPWNQQARLVRIGLKGKVIDAAERPPANLVFLLDVSGSMSAPNKLPLVQQALRMLVENLSERDRVSIVVYAGASGLALPPTPCDRGQDIMDAFARLRAGGSTNGGAGIQLAYKVAQEAFLEGGVNRVILCTDGDFNVGNTSHQGLMDLIAEKARSKVFLTVLGFGMGNLKDHMMEQLADKGNGNYGYVDTLEEARKLLVEELSGTLVTIAKDVKIQVEWNPWVVQSYRLIGYENRKLRDEDFNDDTKDAGEIGAGHAVTALYEVVPTGAARPGVDPLKYQEPAAQPTDAARSGEMLTVKLRYKQPEGDVSELLDVAVRDEGTRFEQASDDLRFAAAVAEFGMLLRGSKHKGASSFQAALEIASQSLGRDPGNHRHEFLDLIQRAARLRRR